ncbi:hypothetical protein O6H91_13G072400 [Diphasiastrum complanatum]|uniref:Uncharacterized protein n=1 Tax=Diphasiastrum complanatum TaxID=34168 RepID=A0ACC2BW54_DIPCM|nr:hypothetical protein O6H91_13G072400 [Diphasiastrum complanatum]
MAMASSSLLCISQPLPTSLVALASSSLSVSRPFPSACAVSISSLPFLRPASESASASEAHYSRNLKPKTPIDSALCIERAQQTCSSTIEKCRFDLANAIENISRAGAIAVTVAGIFFLADPALAYKGGGPYGTEVTRGQDLTGKDFSGKTLVKQDFKTSILRQAKFKGAKLLGASFFDADLTGADLSDADLRGADLSLANAAKENIGFLLREQRNMHVSGHVFYTKLVKALVQANFSNANLEGALVTGNTSFKGAKIEGADFTDVFWRDDQREYLCKIADGVNPTTGNATKDTLLCS